MAGLRVGFIGLGAMGQPMVANLLRTRAYRLKVFDVNPAIVSNVVAAHPNEPITAGKSPAEVSTEADIVISMVPNDKVLREVVCDATNGILATFPKGGVHLSCSTVHPDTSRELASLHADAGSTYVGAPIFARADGVAQRLASFVVGGADASVEKVMPIMEANSNGIFRFGEDPGAGNVVKLCGNYMIACAIESCSEALSLAEKSGLKREDVMTMLNTTIFDCLIYRGYGDRVAQRKHIPGESDLVGPGFQLELGLKDVTLALDVAHKTQAPMPFASALHDRFLGSLARGRGQMDWSAIGLSVSEDAGVDVSRLVPPLPPAK